MRKAIQSFAEQFAYKPVIENADAYTSPGRFVVCGMGGSHLAADLIAAWNPAVDVVIHRDYGLPGRTDDDLKGRLIILSSYSGATEEVLDAFHGARKRRLPLIVIATGGELIERAKEHRLPYIQLPAAGIQPRSALGYSFKAMLAAMGADSVLEEVSKLAETLKPLAYEEEGRVLAGKIQGCVPVIYASERNGALAYNWKIKFNETGKIPAFCNVVPELNHNEMTGFDVQSSTRLLSEWFRFIFLADEHDDPRVQKRIRILQKLYHDRKLPAHIVPLRGASPFERMFFSLIIADWAAYYTAERYGVEAEQVPMVEEFKKLMREEEKA